MEPAAAADTAAAQADGAAPRTDFPCSVAQERFWLLDRLDPGNASFNVAVRWRLEGRVSRDLLERSWLEIIARHEILRTVFVEIDGAPIQRVMPRSPFRLVEIDLTNLPHDHAHAEGDRIGVIEARAPFDLGTGPLIRVTLLRFSPTVAIILVTTHQIVSDGWSIGVMAREMGLIYDALHLGNSAPLDELPIQYADYSLWQLEWLRLRGTAVESAYWSKQLAGVKPFKVIPDKPRPPMPTTNGAIVSRVLPRDLTNRAQAMSAHHGATLFATALTSLCAALARFTGEEEIVIGTQVSDRDQVELEPMIGQFVNSLILRNDSRGDPSFVEFLARVSETSTQALEHRHIPIERLLDMMKSERSHINSAPISVNFIFQKTFIQNTKYADFALIDMPSLPAGAIYDLNFFMVERPDGWRFSCQYNTDQFEGETAERLLDYTQHALESAVADPHRRISELALSAPSEVKNLLGKLNHTRSLYPRELNLAKLFEAQVMRVPGAAALEDHDRRMSYAELDAASSRLARHLGECGVAPRTRVAVCLDRCMELPIVVLAVLKTGATLVPLDPADPPAYRASLLEASRAAAVVVEHGSPSWATAKGVKAIEVRPWPAAPMHAGPGQAGPGQAGPIQAGAAQAGEVQAKFTPIAPIEAEAAACLISRPGETKFHSLSHRNLSNLVYSLAKRPGINDRDVMVATSRPGQGRALAEMLLPLLTGARLVMAQDHDMADGPRLLHLLQRTGATVVHASPRVWAKLTESEWAGYPALKMLCSGIELGAALADRLLSMGGELWTLYGHPETGIWSSTLQLKKKPAMISIGEPLANTALYVLDGRLRAAPVGGVGVIYIGGDGVADSTATVPADPLSLAHPMQLFRTGDLGRLRADGQIEYIGRADHQFRHLGTRVDPIVVERILLRHPLIAQAAVVHRGGEADAGGSIAAYVVRRPDRSRDGLPGGSNDAEALVADLRTSLQASLPHELWPASIELCGSLPHLSDGAIDRRALATAEQAPAAQNSEPSGEIERELAKIWASMLKLDAVAVTHNFFEMGGHSLLAARMLTQIERVFGRRIRLATLFGAPTIRELAKILSNADTREFDFRQVVKIQPHGSRPPLIGINNTGVFYGLAKCLGSDQPVISLQLFDPSVSTASMPETLEEIAAGYVELIGRVQPQGPYELMGWCVAGSLAFEIARQLQESGKEVDNLFLIDSWIPGYFARQSLPRRIIGNYSLRSQVVWADWRKVIAGEQSVAAFFSNRTIVQKCRQLLARLGSSRVRHGNSAERDHATLETYDQWLLGYLQGITAKYEPRRFPVRIALLRSREEPTGWFFRPDAGWASVTTEPIELAFVDGDHFTMFKSPGVEEMGRCIARSIDRTVARTAGAAANPGS